MITYIAYVICFALATPALPRVCTWDNNDSVSIRCIAQSTLKMEVLPVGSQTFYYPSEYLVRDTNYQKIDKLVKTCPTQKVYLR